MIEEISQQNYVVDLESKESGQLEILDPQAESNDIDFDERDSLLHTEAYTTVNIKLDEVNHKNPQNTG